MSAKPAQQAQQAQQRRGGRKDSQQDLNHLLGFTLPPRAPQPTLTHLPRRSNNRSNGRSGGGNGGYGGAFDRSRFVHTFRFIVKPDKDYTAHFADPDLHLEWEDILQVILPTSNSALSTVSTSATRDQADESGKPACPICLSEPTAARMTKCGHVFCFPCVLHYLALAEPGMKFRKCPVCHDTIYAKDLKSVKWFDPVKGAGASSSHSHSHLPPPVPTVIPSSAPIDADLARALELSKLDSHPSSTPSSSDPSSRAERLTLRLMRRPQLTTLALPRSATWPSEAVAPLRAPWQFTPDALTFAKFMLGEPSFFREELVEQRKELEQELASLRRFRGTEEELGTLFVSDAIRRVDKQIAKTELLKTTPVMTARKKARRELEELLEVGTEEMEETSLLEEAAQINPPRPFAASLPLDSDAVSADFLASRASSGTATPLSFTAPSFVPSALSTTAPATSTPSSPPKRTPHPRRNVLPVIPSPETDPSYFFYQASSGQPIFLSPLDIKVLKSHFGTYADMPNSITVTVEGADEGSMNEELRKRCKWLSHLPRGGDVVFVEADFTGVVPRKALEPFAQPLKARRTKRKDRARKEDNARKRSEIKAREDLPIFHSTWAHGEGVPLSYATSSSWDDTSAFPAPPSAPRASSLASSPPTALRPPTSSARPSFASALHASSRSSPAYASGWDEDYDDRWGDLEEQLGRQRAGSPRGSVGGATPPASTPTSAGAAAGGQGKKKKGKKGITLNLTGMRTG